MTNNENELIEPELDLDRGELDDDAKMLDYLNNMSEDEMKSLMAKQSGELTIPDSLAKQIRDIGIAKKKQALKPKKKRNKVKAKLAKASRKRNRRK